MPVGDEFYIGYEGGMPAGTGRAVRRAVGGALLVAVVVAGIVTANQRQLANATFEFGRPRTFDGWLTWAPAPSLLVHDDRGWTRYWLVAQGKFGAAHAVTTADEGWVRLDAARILREGWQMLEVAPGSVVRTSRADAGPPLASETTQPFRGRGEIVDSKCYLGVMNPGERVVHRDCAIRCLSGGIPAMFAYRGMDGLSRVALLVRADGSPVRSDRAGQAGSPVELSGRLHISGEIEVLVIDE
jgi:hypothetical protein